MVTSEKIPRIFRGRLGLGFFALCGGLASLLVAYFLHRAERLAIVQEFERRQNLRHDFLKQSFGEYENSLFALRLVAENNYELTATEFERAARDIQARSPGVLSVQWVPLVPAAELGAFAARVRGQLHPDFRLRERGADDVLRDLESVPGSGRDEYAVITYAYPVKGNEAALGYDILTAPTAPDLLRARRSLGIALTRPILLAQGMEGVVLTCFARRDESPEGPPAGGSGYMQLVLRLPPILDRIWTASPSSIADFALYDVSPDAVYPLYTHLADQPRHEARPASFGEFSTAETIVRDFNIGGRILRACYRPRAGWFASRESPAAVIIFFAGLALTALACAYLRLLLRRAERIREEVALRTAELSDSRALLDTLISHNPSAIWMKDPELRLRLVNDEFCRAHGRNREDILGQRDTALFPPDVAAQIEATDRDILAHGTTRHFETAYPVGATGEMRTYLVAKFPLRNAAGLIHAVAGTATDITELRRVEAARAAIERRLLETQKLESLGVLAGGIAHDFNNLLTGMLGHASLCRAQLPPDFPQQHSLQEIEDAARRAAELCQQMLAYAGRGRFSRDWIELGTLVRETLPLLRLSLGKRARLHLELADDLPGVVADATQLRQIVMNLILNASEALHDIGGDITLRTRTVRADSSLFATCVHAPELPTGDYVALDVADTGRGMSADTLARIFDPFFTTKFTGRGLGLAAVLGIVRGHKGALRVQSEPDRGCVFELYLPAAPASARPAPVAAPQAAPMPALEAKSAPARLLLVDDEESVRETAALLLRNLGYETDTAADGAAALARFSAATEPYDAALIDLTMPGLSGGELLKKLRELRPELPILLMSGYSESDAAAHLGETRTAFLAKPFTLSMLRDSVSALLAARSDAT